MPAVRDRSGVLQVVEAVLALLVPRWRALQHGVRGEMTELDRELLVDLLRFRFGDDVVRHRRIVPSQAPATDCPRRAPGVRDSAGDRAGSDGAPRCAIPISGSARWPPRDRTWSWR